MLAKPVENVDHEGPCVDDLLEARSLADEAECVFAASDQRPATEALEAAIHAAVLRNELLLMAGLDSKPHDIECRHIVLPTVKFPFPNNDAQNADTAGIRDARSVMGVFARVVPRA